MRVALPVLGLTLAAILGCSGAATPPPASTAPVWMSYAPRVEQLVGHRIHEADEWLGAPTLTEDLGQGKTRYTWDWRGGSALTPTGPGSAKAPGFDCLTVIETDQGGVILTTHTEGPTCIGVPPRKGASPGPDETPVTAPDAAAVPAGGHGTGHVSHAPVDDGPVRVHRAGNADPLAGGSEDAPPPSSP